MSELTRSIDESLQIVMPGNGATSAGTAMSRSADQVPLVSPYGHQDLLSEISATYDSTLVRMYCKARFLIININILHILALCLRGKRRVLDIGCGFGLFGCYFASLHPELSYVGYDQNRNRIDMANKAAAKLGLRNAEFRHGDAREMSIDEQFDAVIMVDLMHHIDDEAKKRLVAHCAQHLAEDGNLVIKDISTRWPLKTFFTWSLDVLMTRGFDMHYWSEESFHKLLSSYFNRIDTFPLSDWLPYPHIIYLCERPTTSMSQKVV